MAAAESAASETLEKHVLRKYDIAQKLGKGVRRGESRERAARCRRRRSARARAREEDSTRARAR